MKKAENIKIVSVDLFRTLIDVEHTPETIWHKFLKENYTDALAREYHHRADVILEKRWYEAGIDNNNFTSVRDILMGTITELFREINLDCDIDSAVDDLMVDHRMENVFDDAKPFLDMAGRKHPVCLSTDADTVMVKNIDDFYKFDKVFVSEEMKLYKLNPQFFINVLNHYKIKPENLIHIGDSQSDIIAPRRMGVRTCWVNRKNKKWTHEVTPDFEVKSLLEIPEILG